MTLPTALHITQFTHSLNVIVSLPTALHITHFTHSLNVIISHGGISCMYDILKTKNMFFCVLYAKIK